MQSVSSAPDSERRGGCPHRQSAHRPCFLLFHGRSHQAPGCVPALMTTTNESDGSLRCPTGSTRNALWSRPFRPELVSFFPVSGSGVTIPVAVALAGVQRIAAVHPSHTTANVQLDRARESRGLPSREASRRGGRRALPRRVSLLPATFLGREP